MRALSVRRVAFLYTVACAAVAVTMVWPAGRLVRTDDRNGDGRPDVWRHYDTHGQPTEVDIDTNFDGRSDVHEYYDHGVLVRRESDRNFNDQVDLVDEFDPTTHERIRSIVDLDYDGSADLLVLFQDGRPVLSKRVSALPVNLRHTRDSSARRSPIEPRRDDDRLAPLDDPFRGETAIRQARTTWPFDGGVGLSTSGGLPASPKRAVSPAILSARLVASDVDPRALTDLLSSCPRGPPLS
jgi:hypothetical protein